MTDTYRYRCQHCDGEQELPTNGATHISIGCPDCDTVRPFVKVWQCVECGTWTPTPKFPDTSDRAGPLCNKHYGLTLMNQ